MTVNYYGVEGCTFRTADGNPILSAPPDENEELLIAAGFRCMPDGTWQRALTKKEADALSARAGEETVCFSGIAAGQTFVFNTEPDCTFSYIDGRPAVIPPQNEDADVLRLCGFTQMPDGKWVHLLTKKEYALLLSQPEGTPFSFPQDAQFGTDTAALCMMLISAVLMIAAMILLFTGQRVDFGVMPCFASAIVMYVIARIRAPEYAGGKLFGIFLAVLSAVIVLTACFMGVNEAMHEAVNDCVNCISCQWQKRK